MNSLTSKLRYKIYLDLLRHSYKILKIRHKSKKNFSCFFYVFLNKFTYKAIEHFLFCNLIRENLLYLCFPCSYHIKALPNWNTDDTDTTDKTRIF